MQKKPFQSKPGRGSTTGNKIRLKGDYKEGALVSEDDLDKAIGKTVSGQDYSSVKVDAKGPYVIKIDDKLEK